MIKNRAIKGAVAMSHAREIVIGRLRVLPFDGLAAVETIRTLGTVPAIAYHVPQKPPMTTAKRIVQPSHSFKHLFVARDMALPFLKSREAVEPGTKPSSNLLTIY